MFNFKCVFPRFMREKDFLSFFCLFVVVFLFFFGGGGGSGGGGIVLSTPKQYKRILYYLRFYGVGHLINDHSDSEKGNPLLLYAPSHAHNITYHGLC